MADELAQSGNPSVTMYPEISFEEMEQQNAPATADTPATPTSTLPPDLQGLSMEQMAERLTAQREALRISEEARRATTSTPSTPAPQPQFPTGPAPLTTEQLREMMERDPLEAFAAIAQITRQQTLADVEQRYGSLNQGVNSAIRAQVSTKYQDDFKDFGGEIDEVAAQVQDKRLLNDPKTWDQIVNFVRGNNMHKIVEREVAKRLADGGTTRAAAQEAQRAGSLARVPRSPTPTQADDTLGLDSVALEICKQMRISPADYIKNRF